MEECPQYIRRATSTAENHIQQLQIETWTTTYLMRNWRWAARITKQPTTSWTRLTCAWQPEYNFPPPTTRHQARPHKRWSDDFQAFLAMIHTPPPYWLDAAGDHTNWAQLEHKFITYMNMQTMRLRQQPPLVTQECQQSPQPPQSEQITPSDIS